MFDLRVLIGAALGGALISAQAAADSQPAIAIHGDHSHIRADSHAPVGVMGDHMHKAGEWMVSYRYMAMGMDGLRDGTDDISPEEMVTTVPNRFAGMPGQPPTLRIAPLEMTTQMHMVGAMYAPSDWLTLMAMATYLDKSMDLVTFQGGMGTTRLGEFTTNSRGFGDTKLSAMIRLFENENHHMHLNAGISLPTGSITERDRVLTPMGTTMEMRLPYGMQLGSGTFDLMPGITYTGKSDRFGWGGQLMGTLRIDENDEGYALGDGIQANAWASYLLAPWASISLRVSAESFSDIDGIDPNIMGPVPTADPDYYGGRKIGLHAGLNLAGQDGFLRGHRLALEVGAPVYQDLNGPQMKGEWMLTLGYQYAF